MRAVAVTGANGFIGSHLREELTNRGFRVRGLVRSIRGGAGGPSTSPLVQVDYEEMVSVVSALEGTDAVVHLLGHAHQSASDPQIYDLVNVRYTRRVMESAVQAGVSRFVFVSSVKALGDGAGEPYTADTVPRPVDPYGRSKLEAERVVFSLAGRSDVDPVVLRPPLVYGAGVKGNLRTLIAAIERRWPIPVPRSTANARSLISARNLASAIGETLAWKGTIGEAYLVSDGTELSTLELVEQIAQAAGRRARVVAVPPGALRTLARFVGREPSADRFMGSLRVDGAPFRQRFGWDPRQTVEEGLREAVEGYRSAARAG